MNLILCGYKSCGKTTIGKAYCEKYGTHFIDTDDLLLTSPYQSIRDMHKALGESCFRQLEAEMITNLPDLTNTIIATGGGAVRDPRTVAFFKRIGLIIYLDTDPETLSKRLLSDKTLPSFIDPTHPQESVADYLNSRNDLYDGVSDHTIYTSGKSVEDIIVCLDKVRCLYGQ